MVIVLIGQFIKNIGGLPCAYVFMALFADNLDHLEWKTGFRSDGTAMSIYNVIAVAAAGICTGVFNYFLSSTGYIPPVDQATYLSNTTQYLNLETQKTLQEIISLNAKDSVAFIQPEATNAFITFAFVGFEVITGLACALILLFINVEKTVTRKQEVLVEREKKLYATLNKEWMPSEERNALAMLEQEKEAYDAYVEELKIKCCNKGLNFEKELAKFNLPILT